MYTGDVVTHVSGYVYFGPSNLRAEKAPLFIQDSEQWERHRLGKINNRHTQFDIFEITLMPQTDTIRFLNKTGVRKGSLTPVIKRL